MPHVGQIVLHYKAGGDASKPQPAIVTRVHADEAKVNIGIWNTNGVPNMSGATNVLFVPDTAKPPPNVAYCKPL